MGYSPWSHRRVGHDDVESHTIKIGMMERRMLFTFLSEYMILDMNVTSHE